MTYKKDEHGECEIDPAELQQEIDLLRKALTPPAIGKSGPWRTIITKHGRIYELDPNQQGIPVDEYYPGVTLPAALKGAKVYDTKDGTVIAIPSTPAAQKPRQSKIPQP
jgi:hypothetical protein